MARRGFRRSSREPAITQALTTAAPLPCRASAGSSERAAPTRRTLPVFRGRRLPQVGRARASPRPYRTPSQVSGGLRPAGHVARGVTPSPSRMSGCHPGIVTSLSRELSRGRTQKRPVTHRSTGFSPSGIVSGGPHWQALWFAPFVVELFPAAFSSGGPRTLAVRSVSSPRRRSPRQPRCAGVTALTPRTGFSPALCHRGLVPEACPCRPRSGGLHRIERPGCVPHFGCGLWPGEPPSNRTSASRRIRLYGPARRWCSRRG